jgi:CheY-like chemotaxis protein
MKIFILEDSQERRKVFHKMLSPTHDLSFFGHVEDAKIALRTGGPFDILFLDHDLDNRVFVDSEEENTGYQLAKYIAENNVHGKIIIHSMNPYGAARMQEILPDAQRISFPDLFSQLKLIN